MGQPTAPIIPAIISLGESLGASGRRLLREHDKALNAILHAAVAARRNFPIPFELEVAVFPLGNQILRDTRMRGRLQASIFDAPRISARSFTGGIDPVIHGPAIKQQLPALGAFFRGERVVRFSSLNGKR